MSSTLPPLTVRPPIQAKWADHSPHRFLAGDLKKFRQTRSSVRILPAHHEEQLQPTIRKTLLNSNVKVREAPSLDDPETLTVKEAQAASCRKTLKTSSLFVNIKRHGGCRNHRDWKKTLTSRKRRQPRHLLQRLTWCGASLCLLIPERGDNLTSPEDGLRSSLFCRLIVVQCGTPTHPRLVRSSYLPLFRAHEPSRWLLCCEKCCRLRSRFLRNGMNELSGKVVQV